MSMINPGTSINFDGHVLEEQAEAELEKEDQRCQQEVAISYNRAVNFCLIL